MHTLKGQFSSMDANMFQVNVIKRPIGFSFELAMIFLFLGHLDFVASFLRLSK